MRAGGGGVAPPEDLSTTYSFNFDDQVSSIPLRTYPGWTSTDDGNAARDLLQANTQQLTRTGSDFTQPPRAIVHIDQNLTGNVSFSFRGKTGRTSGEVVLGGTDRSNYVFATLASRTAQGASGGGPVSRVSKRLAGAVTNTGMVEAGFNAAPSTGLHEGGDNELMEFRVFPSAGVVEYYLNGRLNYTRTGIDTSTGAVWGGLYGFSTASGPTANIDDVVARTLSNRLTINNFAQPFYASDYTGDATSAGDFTGATVALSGTYQTSGTIPTALQYRVISTDAAYLAPTYATAPATAASATALTGYQVSADDFATLLTISSAELVGTNVVITLAADPGVPVKVRSFHGKQPDITSWVYGTYTSFSRIALEPLYAPLTTT